MILTAVPVLVMAGVTLYVGFNYLLLWMRVREEIGYLYFFGLCTAVAAYDVFSAMLYDSGHFAAGIWWQRGQFSAIAAIALWMMLFAARFLRKELTARLRLLFALYAVFIFAPWIDSPLFLHLSRPAPKTIILGPATFHYLEVQPGPLLMVFFLLIFVGILISTDNFANAYRRRHVHGSALIQTGLTVFFLAGVNDMLVGAGVLKFVYLLEYAFLAVILAMDFLQQRNHLDLVEQEKLHGRALESCLARIKTLEGLLPICSSCDRIQNEQGNWQQAEEYVARHSLAGFSHGICPDCAAKLFPEYDRKYERRVRKRRKADQGKTGQG